MNTALDATVGTALRAVGKALAHIPRVVDAKSVTHAREQADHVRLRERLSMYGLDEREVRGDGNCQFRALSDQIFRDGGGNHAVGGRRCKLDPGA